MKPSHWWLVGLPLLPSCSLLITAPTEEPTPPLRWQESVGTTPVLVFSHGYHTGLALPADSLRTHLPELCQGLTDEWLEFGWGDEGFYRTEEVNAKLVFSALCYPTPGVVHVAILQPPVHRYYLHSPNQLLEIHPEETNRLGLFLAETFARDSHHQLLPLGPGRYGLSAFYRARDSYYFPRSCNSWTARGLQAAGYDVFAVTAPGLMKQIKREPSLAPE